MDTIEGTDEHLVRLQAAYLHERFEMDTGRPPLTRIELLNWVASTGIAPEGPAFEAWCRKRAAQRRARKGAPDDQRSDANAS